MALNLKSAGLRPIGEVDIPDIYYNRYKSGIEEFDQLLGGGALPGSVVTLCAKGGLGKSTLLLQALQAYDTNSLNVAYFSGEESVEQIAFKCSNLNVGGVPVDNVTDINEICNIIEDTQLNIVVIDSFQHLTIDSDIGDRKLQKYAIDKICDTAQATQCTVFIIMHVTKAGILKGDSYVPHTADVNLEIRSGEDEYGDKDFRILEIPDKNRFGPLTEVVTKMSSNGFIFTVEVPEKQDTTKSNKRTQAKQNEFDSIMKMAGGITPNRVMDSLGVDYNHAYGRLAELYKNGKLNKIGKGQNAIFTVIEP